jgi:hypothetical protein
MPERCKTFILASKGNRRHHLLPVLAVLQDDALEFAETLLLRPLALFAASLRRRRGVEEVAWDRCYNSENSFASKKWQLRLKGQLLMLKNSQNFSI